ncbi:hypothetical protein J5N97_026056 [Dioscorea zingiberensis]|uniref:Transposase (putative) gypsy type domain-containing protein n=1 Tax=Dioscorea zingiberensis TaxID=325984 RepID=A0A9D5C2P2_9LILI|nr:hypothetical protein J5N97_026056 [Dioscorea zingiberensis]
MASATSSSSSSSHGPLIPSPSNPVISGAAPGDPRDVLVQGPRIHPASRAMGRGSGTFISLLGQKDVDSLVEKYEIDPTLFEVRVPCSGERASSPKEGEIAIYQDALSGGLRLPFSNFAKAILEEYHLCPSQLTLNSWRLLNGFVVVFKNYGVNLTVRWFRMLFSLCLESNADWYYFSARSGRKFLGKVPSSIKRWKSKFFFIKSKSEWDVRTKWEVTRTDIACEEMTKKEEVLLKSVTGLSKVYMDEFLTKEYLVRCRLIVSAENPIEDEDLSYVKGLLASFEGEVHPPLPRGRKKKEAVSSIGSSREKRTKRKNFEDASGPEIVGEQAEVPPGEVCAEKVRPALSPISEGPSSSRPEDILLMETTQWADRVGNLCQEDLAKTGAYRAKIAQLNSKVAALEGKEKEQLAIIHTYEKDKAERLQQLAVMITLAVWRRNSNLLKGGQAEARWELKLKGAELAAVQAELEEVKGECDTLKADLASRLKTNKSDWQEIKDSIERADKLEKEVARLRAKAKEGATRIYSVVQQVGHHIPSAEVLSMGLAGVLKTYMELKEQQIIKTLEAYVPAPSEPSTQVPSKAAGCAEGPSS